jgi:hypothetical protein
MAPSSRKKPSNPVLPGLRFGRRKFLQGSLAVPLLATAAASETTVIAEIDLAFTWNEAQTELTIASIQDEIIAVEKNGEPSWAHAGKPKIKNSWKLRPESFGPDARFVLGRRDPSGADLGGYRLRVLNASMGRINGRQFDLQFRRYAEPEDGNDRDGLLTKFRVSASVRLWSSAKTPLAVQPFSMETRDPNTNELKYPDGDRRNLPLFETIAQGGTTPLLSQIVTVAQVDNTFRLLFNGMIGFAKGLGAAGIRLDFANDATWSVSVPKASGPLVVMRVLHRNLKLNHFTFVWAPPELAGNANDDPWRKAHLRGWGKPIGQLDLDFGSDTGPRVLVRRSWEADTEVFLRAVSATQEDTPATYLTEAGMVLDEAMLRLQGDPSEQLGDLKRLHLRLLSRTSAAPLLAPSEPVELAGTLTIDGYAQTAKAALRVATPIGGLELAVLAEREEAEEPEEGEDPPTLRELAFAARTPRPVLIALSWLAGRRDLPKTDWVEIHARLTRADLALPGAESSRLDFEPTDLLVHYAPEGLAEEPLTSVLRLGEITASPRARLDLTRATLRAGRGSDLLSLTFRFLDISLVCRGPEMELVALSPRCLAYRDIAGIESGRSATPEPGLPDVRPILVVEFPPQHLMETALAIQNDPEPKDVEVAKAWFDVNLSDARIDTLSEPPRDPKPGPAPKGWFRVNINNRRSVVEALALMPAVGTRKAFRQVIRDWKAKASEDFKIFADDAEKILAKLGGPAPLPPDQRVYIGPFALDPDALGAIRQLARRHAATKLTDSLRAMALEVHRQAAAIPLLAAPGSALADYAKSPANGLLLEGLLESAVPSYAEFRSWYRDWAIRAFEEAQKGAPASLDAAEIEVFWQGVPRPEFAPPSKPPEPEWDPLNQPIWSAIAARIARGWGIYVSSLAQTPQPGGLTEGRLSGPTRLAFRIKCRDGLVAGRLRVPAFDHDPDLTGRPAGDATSPDRPGLRRDRFPFTLDTLTGFGDMELSVTRRAERIYAPDGAGRVDAGGRRRLQLNVGAMLDHLGFRSGGFLTSSERLADIQASLVPPSRYETAIEIPARLVLSPHQEARFLTRRSVPAGVYDKRGDKQLVDKGIPVSRGPLPLWSADLLTDEGDPGLRAVYSPDLAPDFVWRRLHQASPITGTDLVLPGGAAPLRGPWAPWTIGREETGLAIPSPREIAKKTGDPDVQKILESAPDDTAFCAALDAVGTPEERRNKFAGLIEYLCGRRTKGTPSDRQFRAPMDARARHELVLLSSTWGLPVVGRRMPGGGIADNSSQVEPDARDRPVDLYPGSALYLPKTLDVRELSLTALGGSFRHDTIFEPPAGAFHLSGAPLFDALSIEKWQQWTLLGRDIVCEIVYKGFLFPFGHRASLVQLTERTFFQDTTAARGVKPIRAYLNQRLFIRVGKPTKVFSAVGQPLQGRMWPARSVKIVTSETPDLTDPMADFPQGASRTQVLACGRIEIPGSTGLAFWPRTARTRLADLRFEVEIDAAKTSLPMIFADNVLANDPVALEKLATYYNDAAQSALREVALGGQKMRYADERQSGSASIETQSWLLAVSGGQSGKPDRLADQTEAKDKINRIVLTNADYRFLPILQGADQPPFYPVVERAKVYLRQTEKLTGQSFGPVPARFDGAYLANGLPPIGDETPAQRQAEMYLAVQMDANLDIGDGGDRAGGIVRPNAIPVGFSRARGVLTWGHAAPLAGGTREWEEISAWFHTAAKDTATKAQPVPLTAMPKPPSTIAADAFSEAKLLGTIKMSKLLKVLTTLNETGILGEAVSELTEHVRYGVEGMNLAELLAVVRDGVVLPLSEIVADTQALWLDVGQTIAAAQKDTVEAVGAITLAELFPELDASLTALGASLQASLRETEPLSFSLSLGAIYEAGRRLIDAIARTVSNPAERFELALKSRIAQSRAILDGILTSLPEALAKELGVPNKEEAKELLLDWLREKLSPIENTKIRFFAPSGFWIAGERELVDQINKALEPLDWSSDDLKNLVLSFAGYFADTVFDDISKLKNPQEFFKQFLEQDSARIDPNLQSSTTPPLTVKDWLIAQTKGKLDAALNELELLAQTVTDQVVKDLQAEIQGIKAILQEAAEQQVGKAIDWLVEEFFRELLIIDAACATFATVRQEIAAGRLLSAAQAALRFLELFTGPLGIDLAAECNRLVKPISGLLTAFDISKLTVVLPKAFEEMPKAPFTFSEADHGLVLFQIGQLHDIAAQAEKDIKTAPVEIEKEIPNLPTKFREEATRLNSRIKDAHKAVDSIRQSTNDLITVLAFDSLTARALNARLAALAGAVSTAGDAGLCAKGLTALEPFRHLDRDLAAFLRGRKVIVEQVQTTARDIVTQLGVLATNDAVQIGAALVALVTALDDAGFDSKNLKKLAEDAQAFLDQSDRKLAAGIIHALDWSFTQLQVIVDQWIALRDAVLNGYEGKIKSFVELTGFEENIKQIETYKKAFDDLRTKIATLKSQTKPDPQDADNNDPTIKKVKDTLSSLPAPNKIDLFPIKPEPGVLTLELLAALETRLLQSVDRLQEIAANLAIKTFDFASKALDDSVKKVLTTEIPGSGYKVPALYAAISEVRSNFLADFEAETSGYVVLDFALAMDGDRAQALEKAGLAPQQDALEADKVLLEYLAAGQDIASNPALRKYLLRFLREWGNSSSTPVLLAEKIVDLARTLIRGDVLRLIDLNRLRNDVETQLKSLLPLEIRLKHSFAVVLEDGPVREATGGLLQPQGDPTLKFGAEVIFDPLAAANGGQAVTFAADGSLGRFDIKLVGDFIDALTLRFAGARFTAGTGKKARFDVDYIGHKVGPALEFVEQLSTILNPGAGSGPYIRPNFSPIGIQAGYMLDVGAFSLGAVAFDNIKLDCSVILPFSDDDARFRASLSSRDSPFTISYLPWGGSGFFAIEANPDGIVALELQFEFGGAAIFAFGPLVGRGRAMAGLYVRTITVGERRITEIQATFFVGGSAKIWIFSFGASLLVRLGQVDGAMTGEAVFTYSFSIGIKDFEFSVRIVKKENKGYSGNSSNGNVRGASLYAPRRYAQSGEPGSDKDPPLPDGANAPNLPPTAARIDTKTKGPGEDWSTYCRYFAPFESKEYF